MEKEESATVTADEIREQYKKFVGRKILFIVIFTALIVGITGVSTSLGSADLSVWDAYSSILRKPFPNTFESKYTVTLDDVPGSDDKKLLLYLSEEYGIGWAEGAEIIRSDDGMIITVINGENSATITLDEDDATKAELKIAGVQGKTTLEVREKNGEIRIHESTWLADVCVWNLMPPRIVLGILAGIGLGLAGAVILISADLVARRIIAPVIRPVGAVTAFMGAPLFMYLIMRRRREYW